MRACSCGRVTVVFLSLKTVLPMTCLIGPPAKVLQLMRRNPVFVFVRIFVFQNKEVGNCLLQSTSLQIHPNANYVDIHLCPPFFSIAQCNEYIYGQPRWDDIWVPISLRNKINSNNNTHALHKKFAFFQQRLFGNIEHVEICNKFSLFYMRQKMLQQLHITFLV